MLLGIFILEPEGTLLKTAEASCPFVKNIARIFKIKLNKSQQLYDVISELKTISGT